MMEVQNARKPTLYLDVVMQSLTYVGMVTRREKGAVYAGAYSLLYGAWTSFLVEYVMFKLNEIHHKNEVVVPNVLHLKFKIKMKTHFVNMYNNINLQQLINTEYFGRCFTFPKSLK